jgi:hypothetical protein
LQIVSYYNVNKVFCDRQEAPVGGLDHLDLVGRHGSKGNIRYKQAQISPTKTETPNVCSVSTMPKSFKGGVLGKGLKKVKKILGQDKSSSATNPPSTASAALSVTQLASASLSLAPPDISTSAQLHPSHSPPFTVAVAHDVTPEASAPVDAKSHDRIAIAVRVLSQILNVATAASAVFPPAQSAFGAASATLNMVQVMVLGLCGLCTNDISTSRQGSRTILIAT